MQKHILYDSAAGIFDAVKIDITEFLEIFDNRIRGRGFKTNVNADITELKQNLQDKS